MTRPSPSFKSSFTLFAKFFDQTKITEKFSSDRVFGALKYGCDGPLMGVIATHLLGVIVTSSMYGAQTFQFYFENCSPSHTFSSPRKMNCTGPDTSFIETICSDVFQILACLMLIYKRITYSKSKNLESSKNGKIKPRRKIQQ